MNKFIASLGVVGIVLLVCIPVLLGIGWFRNLVKFIDLDFKAPYKAEIIRGVGLTSYGVIIGWIKIEDR